MKKIVAVALACALGLLVAGLGGCGGSGDANDPAKAQSGLPPLETLAASPNEVAEALADYPNFEDGDWAYFCSDESCATSMKKNKSFELSEGQWVVGVSERYYDDVGIQVQVAPLESSSSEDVAEAFLALYPDTDYLAYYEDPRYFGAAIVEGHYIYFYATTARQNCLTLNIPGKGLTTVSEIENFYADSDYTYKR